MEIELTEREVEIAGKMGVSLAMVKKVKQEMAAKEQPVKLGVGVNGASAYGMFEAQDIRFIQAFQLTEPTFISLCGGLSQYLSIRMSREKLRLAGKQPPVLPCSFTKEDVTIMSQLNVNPANRAGVELAEHKKALGGMIQGLPTGKGG